MQTSNMEHRISFHEDTGKMALYKGSVVAGVMTWEIIAHEEEFETISKLLEKHDYEAS